MDAGAAAIQEESDGDFYFEQREVGASVRWMCWAVQAGVEAHQRASERNGRPTHSIFKRKKEEEE
jgi:hypothetical protein